MKILDKYNVIHRDLKLANILVHNDIAKISDFGFAK
jgi:serine/threonine protein kinase